LESERRRCGSLERLGTGGRGARMGDALALCRRYGGEAGYWLCRTGL